MSSKYPKVTVKKKWKDVLEIVEKEQEGLSPMMKLLRKGQGILVPVLMRYTYFEERANFIDIKFIDQELSIPISVADKFWYVAKFPMTSFMLVTMSWGIVPGFSYKTQFYEEKPPPVHVGQFKLCASTLEVLCGHEPELRLMVIGSNGEGGVSGTTYHMLIDYLELLGYNGSMLFLDPYEIPRHFQTKSFDVEFRKSFFDYRASKPLLMQDGFMPNVVLDDAWVPTWTRKIHPKVEYDDVVVIPSEGISKFAYLVSDNVLTIKMGLRNHTDLEGAIGGGRVACCGKKLSLFGTSNRCGPYDKTMIAGALESQGYSVHVRDDIKKYGRYTWDENLVLRKLYPDARISMKCFTEDIPGPGRFVQQIWYDGLERRFLYNVPEFSRVRAGCGCNRCEQYAYVLNHFTVYTNLSKNVVAGMLTRVIRDKCLKNKSASFNNVMGLVMSYSRTSPTYNAMVMAVASKCRVSDIVVDRAAYYLYRKGNIALNKQGFYPLRDFYHDGDTDMWYSKCGRFQVKRHHGALTVYDAFGTDVTARFRSGVLTYDKGKVKGYSDFVDIIKEKFIDIYSCIEGTSLIGHGLYPCGYTKDYPLVITRDSFGKILYESKGFYLIYHVAEDEW